MYRELPVCTADGYDLATWFFPAQEALTNLELQSSPDDFWGSMVLLGLRLLLML